MKNTQIKVTRVDNMTTKQRDTILEDRYTINLTWEISSRQRIKNRIISRRDKRFHELIPYVLLVIVFILAIITAWSNVANANSTMQAPLEKDSLKSEELSYEEQNPMETYEELIQNWEKAVRILWSNVEEKAFEFIVQFEWYHDKPYWDFKQYSCWYGMKCNKDTTWITKEKSKWFVIERIKQIREKHNLEQYDDDIEVALISFVYNIWHTPVWMEWYIDNWYINALKNMMRKYSYAGWKHLRWLAIRRNAECDLF